MQAGRRATDPRTSMDQRQPDKRPHVTGAIAIEFQQLARTAQATHHRRTLPPPDNQPLALLESL